MANVHEPVPGPIIIAYLMGLLLKLFSKTSFDMPLPHVSPLSSGGLSPASLMHSGDQVQGLKAGVSTRAVIHRN